MNRIHTYIEIDIETGQVLADESFLHEGPIAECKGGSSAPKMTPEERALYATQNELLQLQMAETKQLTPILYRQMGMKQVKGNWVPMTAEEKLAEMDPYERAALEYDMLRKGMDISGNKLTEEEMLARMLPAEAAAYRATALSNERYMQALRGELPISPGLEQELQTQEQLMTDTLGRKLGADWMLTTPGQKAYQSMKQKADLVREEARRGEIDSASNRMSQNMTTIQNLNAEKANDLQFVTGKQQQLITNLANMPGRTMGTMQSAGEMAQPFERYREMQNAVKQQNAANSAAQTSGYVGAGATVAAAAAAAAY